MRGAAAADKQSRDELADNPNADASGNRVVVVGKTFLFFSFVFPFLFCFVFQVLRMTASSARVTRERVPGSHARAPKSVLTFWRFRVPHDILLEFPNQINEFCFFNVVDDRLI